MKKVLFAVALVMGLGSSVAFAGNMVSDVEIVVMVNDYKPVSYTHLDVYKRQIISQSR